jgi:DNA-binding NarL/FixJ family response regulator
VIEVLVVDDQALVRGGLRSILEREDDIAVVGEAGDGLTAVRLAEELRPSVVLMDVRMPHLDGIEATRRILRAPSPPRVVVLTTYDADEHLYDALRAGASGFLLKDTEPERLPAAVRVVAAGESLLGAGPTRRLIETFVSRPAPGDRRPPQLAELTERELEVLEHVARGRSNREIADRLVLGEATVKTHVGRVFAKLGVRDRAQAVIAAYEAGLVVPGDGG